MHIFYESWLHRVEWWYRNGSMFCSFFSKDRQCRKENEYIKNYPFRTIVNSIHVFYWPSVMNLLALKCSAKNNWIVWYLSWNTKKYVNYAHSGLRKWVMDQVIFKGQLISKGLSTIFTWTKKRTKNFCPKDIILSWVRA